MTREALFAAFIVVVVAVVTACMGGLALHCRRAGWPGWAVVWAALTALYGAVTVFAVDHTATMLRQ